ITPGYLAFVDSNTLEPKMDGHRSLGTFLLQVNGTIAVVLELTFNAYFRHHLSTSLSATCILSDNIIGVDLCRNPPPEGRTEDRPPAGTRAAGDVSSRFVCDLYVNFEFKITPGYLAFVDSNTLESKMDGHRSLGTFLLQVNGTIAVVLELTFNAYFRHHLSTSLSATCILSDNIIGVDLCRNPPPEGRTEDRPPAGTRAA
ncbi:hypothetical protein Trydic_g6727, partial [Trypoxylus dichotomus]